VDCELNSTENGGYACYRFKGASMAALFHPLITVDLREGAAAVRARPVGTAAAKPSVTTKPTAPAVEEEDDVIEVEEFGEMPDLEELEVGKGAGAAAGAAARAGLVNADFEELD